MSDSAQVFEKNHFLNDQNRAKVFRMSDIERNRTRIVMLIIAAALALATLAPVVVLAG